MSDHTSSGRLAKLIIDKTDACVACGLCLDHCPTYRLHETEAESPRGRIAIASGLASGRIAMSRHSIVHLDSCLVCGSCEKVCPANVQYTEMIDQTRTLIFDSARSSWIDRFFNWLTADKKRLNIVGWLLWLYRKAGLRKLTGYSSLSRLPGVIRDRSLDDFYPASGPTRGRVYLFRGCVAELFDQLTLRSAIALLNHCGYDVMIPPQQSCCGAVAAHCGDAATADLHRQRNRAVFTEPLPLIVTSSGCAAVLKQDSELDVRDINEFLAAVPDGHPGVSSISTKERIGVYLPCTLRNKLDASQGVYTLLRKAGVTDFIDLSGETNCCGAAGTYMFRHADEALYLKERLYSRIEREKITLVLTMNIGCLLHLLNYNGHHRFRVMHLVSYLAQG